MRTLFLFTLLVASIAAQTTVTRIELRPDPASTDLRPGEFAVIQVRVYGEITSRNSEGTESKRSGRLQDQKFTVRIVERDGGWVSKPFKYQGSDTEGFISENSGGMFSQILRSAAGNFISKDSYLYTAPQKPGKYTIEASGSNITGKVEFNVSASAPSRLPKEKFSFDQSEARTPSETKNEFYRKLAERYAPYVAQETWFDPIADIISRFDFDKDWNGGNNWRNLGEGSMQAYGYYAVVETRTHWFIHYNYFHPRDYSDNCIAGMCHENDNEGIILTVKKSEGGEFGKVVAMETLAHNNVYSYTNERNIGNAAHNIEGPIAFYDETHPIIFIEAGGHGVISATDKKSFFNPRTMEWTQNTGMTFVFKGKAERATSAMSKDIGYELLPIYDHWWTKMNSGWKENTFDAFYDYKPFGGRPAGLRRYSGAFHGREKSANKARPFWGWFDSATQRRKILSQGQWALDPAYSVTRNLKFPSSEDFSLEYTYNPYLGIEP